MNVRSAIAVALSAACFPVAAQTVWTDWTSATTGEPGSAAGTLGGVAVTYSGEVLGNTVTNGSFAPSWAPATSFVGGTVTTSPATAGDIITMNGSTLTNTITFASPIVNPVFAIWSLGAGGAPASFTFNATPTFEVGGPNVGFGGQAITVAGNAVNGVEGNGVVQFTGTFSSISFTTTPENFYGFTVGRNGAVTAVPEPETWALMAAGLAALGSIVRKRRSRAA